jgi:hypothetical protein
MCLTHSTGFANFFFIEPDERSKPRAAGSMDTTIADLGDTGVPYEWEYGDYAGHSWHLLRYGNAAGAAR